MNEGLRSILRRCGSLAQLLGERRNLIPAVIFLFFFVMLICLKLIRQEEQYGDTALYLQITDNIANRGVPMSSVFAAVSDFTVNHHFATMPASAIAQDPLAIEGPAEINYFTFHAHYILYPIAVLAKLFGSRVTLLSLFMLSFTGLVLVAYLKLRDWGIPVVAGALFCVLIVSHPAWSQGVLWQFYPERLFVLAGFALMLFTSQDRLRKWPIVVLGLICALITERAAILAGGFLILYGLLYWGDDRRSRIFKIGLGLAFFLYGVFVLKFVLTNAEYSAFLPTSAAGFSHLFDLPRFGPEVAVFFVVNGVLLALALFEWRAAVIAVTFMLPNIFGNIGGAEKIGWATHYHDLYLPALVWAAMLGYRNAYRLATTRRLTSLFYTATCGLILLLACNAPTPTAVLSFAPRNLQDQFFPSFVAQTNQYFGPDGTALDAAYSALGKLVPPGVVATVPEAAMTELYRGRVLEMFPIDVDHADYAVLTYTAAPGGKAEFHGAVSYLGPAEAAKIDLVINNRMRRDGYDFAHVELIPRLGLAVVRRAAPNTRS